MPRLHDQGKSKTFWDSAYDDRQYLADWINHDFDYEKLLTLMQPHAGMQLLDIGCGSGDALAAAESFDIDAIGIETTPEAAAVSQKYAPQSKVVVGSPQEIPFDNEQFDLVTCFGVMDFFSNPGGGMREIHRVLKKQGRACIVLPNADYIGLRNTAGFEQLEYEVFYPLDTWKTMMKATGLILTDLRFNRPVENSHEQFGGWFGTIKRWLISLLAKLFPRTYASQFICICQKIGD